jgi:hypothetical protein
MPINSLQAAIIGIGAFISVICLTGIMLPTRLLHAARSAWQYRAALVVAVMIRLTIGVLLLLAATHSRFPLAFKILGGLAIVAALLIPLIGHDRISRLLARCSRQSVLFIRLWSLAGLAFGCFLIYAAT